MKRIYALLLCMALMLAALSFSFTAFAAGEEGEEARLEIIIKFYDRSQFPGQEKQYDNEVSKVLKDGLYFVTDNTYVIAVDDLNKNPNAILNQYKNSKFIEYVEENYKAGFEATPNDTNYASMRAALTAINAQAGWDIVTGGGPIVAVIDSGVYQHPDLPVLLPGYSAVAGLSPNNDKMGHGTGVAGTIGALGNNGLGTVGINWNARIMPVKVDDANGTLTVANIAKGIIWAADNGAKVISLSVSTTSDSVTLKNAIDYAYGKGCAIFASTGNDGKNTVNYPARYSNVMAVGATGNAVSRINFSNYGTGMGVVAISSYMTTTASGGYTAMSGTSFSTPQVSGLASLIWALNPSLTNEQVYSYIQRGAKPLGGGYNTETGYGVIDIGKTLQLVEDEMTTSTPAQKKDTTPPVLTLKGALVMEIKQGTAFSDPGWTAIDDVDGDISDNVTKTGTVNVNVPGVYRVEYKVSDAAGNTSSATRTVQVIEVNTTPPAITLIGGQTIQVRQGVTFVDPGYTAISIVHGDVTGRVVATGTVNVNAPGTYTRTYTVTDTDGNTATATRIVQVIAVDTTPPVLTLKGTLTMQIEQGKAFVEPGWTAIDNVDGDITSKVVATGTVNVNTPGTYTLTYTVSDTAGNTATATRTVQVVAVPQYTKPPVITLDGSAEVTMFVDDQYIEPGYKAVDCLGFDLTGAVRVTSNVNIMTPGIYTITYDVEDAGGNKARATRTVFVIEREVEVAPPNAPTLTIIGSNPIILHLGSGTDYVEQGAQAWDEIDGDISDKVTITGSVDRNTAGVYIITYKVVNSIGLEATATREVRIMAPTEIKAPRATYNFSGQGKAVSTITHSNIVADDDGWMDFAVTSIDKNMTIKVEIKKQGNANNVIFSGTYTAVGGTQFWADEGVYDVYVTITVANGNSKYGVRVVTPEVIYFVFPGEEVPLSPLELPIELYIVTLGYTMQEMFDEGLGFTKAQMLACLEENNFTREQMLAFGFKASELPGNNGFPMQLLIVAIVLLCGIIAAALVLGRRNASPKNE